MKHLIILALFFISAQAVFIVNDSNNVTCLLLDIEGTLLLQGQENNSFFVTKSIKIANGIVLEPNSTCTKIILELGESVLLGFEFHVDTIDNGSWVVTPSVEFNSSAAFAWKNIEIVQADAAKLQPFPKTEYFVCQASNVLENFTLNGNYSANYTVDANLTLFKIESMKNASFQKGEECDQDKTTPASTSTTQSTTTAAPTENTFTCKLGNTTKFIFQANFSLEVTYEAKDNNVTKNVTAYLDIPLNSLYNTVCNDEIMESFNVTFFNQWVLHYTFHRDSNTSKNYNVGDVTLYYSTSFFHDDARNLTLSGSYNGSSTYLQATSDGYFVCNSNSSISLSDNVKLYTRDLKYFAFNSDQKRTLESGDATQCSADEETSSVVPIAVGAALAGLVVIVLIAYLIGRRRSRKSGYESV